MGCGASGTAVQELGDGLPDDWITITVDPKSGGIVVKAPDADETSIKFNTEIPATAEQKRMSFVKRKAGGTLDQVGGEVKVTVVKPDIMDKLKEEANDAPFDPTDPNAETESCESKNSSGRVKRGSVVSAAHACNVVGEYKGETFLITGSVGGNIHIIAKETGLVVVTLWHQGTYGLEFYDGLFEKKSLRMSSTEQEQQDLKNALCGKRVDLVKNRTKFVIRLKPDMIEKLPVSLFAMATLYSDLDLNGLDA